MKGGSSRCSTASAWRTALERFQRSFLAARSPAPAWPPPLPATPPVLVADEPTAEVDRDTEAGLIAHFEARRAAGLSTLLATHSEALARRADRIVRLKDGRIENG